MSTKAKDSPQIQKARKKIKEQLKLSEKRMNTQALLAMSLLIKEQLKRQKTSQINFKKREIKQVGSHPVYAKTQSKFILKLMNQIKEAENKQKIELEGRIKKQN